MTSQTKLFLLALFFVSIRLGTLKMQSQHHLVRNVLDKNQCLCQCHKFLSSDKVMNRYILDRSIGEGAFGKVRKAIHKDSGDEVAIKTLREKCKSVENMMSLPEVKALRSLSHENIVKCRELVLDRRGEVHLVFEMLSGGNLETLTRNRTKPFSEHQIRSVFFQLLSAAQYMHSLNFMHRDIKPENILLQSPRFEHDTRIKLADLGLAKRCSLPNARPHTTYVATRWYRSPELLLRISSYSFPSDLWAIGAVMTELINLGKPLFPGNDEIDQLSRIVSVRGHPSIVGWRSGELALKNRRIQLPRVTPSSLRRVVPRASLPVLQLISDLLELDPSRRPTAAEALQYPLFMSFPSRLSEQNPSRKRRKLNSLGRDTPGTRDFPSSQGSGGTADYQLEQIPSSGQIEPLCIGSPDSTVKNIESRFFSLNKRTASSKLFNIPRFSDQADQKSFGYHELVTLRDPAGKFDLGTM